MTIADKLGSKGMTYTVISVNADTGYMPPAWAANAATVQADGTILAVGQAGPSKLGFQHMCERAKKEARMQAMRAKSGAAFGDVSAEYVINVVADVASSPAQPETAERELIGALIAHAVVASAARVTTKLAGKDAWNDPSARRCVVTHGLEIVTAAVAVALDPSPRRQRDLQNLLRFAGANRQRRRPGRTEKRVAYRKGSMWLWEAERRSA